MNATTTKQQDYRVTGMTCGGCVASVQRGLDTVPGVTAAEVQLESPQARITLDRDVDLATLQAAIGKYHIEPIDQPAPPKAAAPAPPRPAAPPPVMDVPEANVTTYRPLILIVSFIAGVTLLAQFPFATFSGMLWMRDFMAGFFIVFAFFKLLNLRGFADSYAMYDIVAARWHGWGYVYPFVELTLGLLYLTGLFPFWTNVATIIVLGISSIGVIQSNLNKRKIKCACLGDVFNLPMSTVTIVEDVGMVAMAVAMLLIR